MAVLTFLDIHTTDAAGRDATLTYRIKPAAFGATNLPASAVINAVINSHFGDAKLSTNIVKSYAIRVVEDAPTAVGGSGTAPSSQAARLRSEISDGNWLTSVPGLNQGAVVFDPTNPNSISVSGTIWDTIRAALVDSDIAVSDPVGAYSAAAETDIAQVATLFDGKRAPARPR